MKNSSQPNPPSLIEDYSLRKMFRLRSGARNKRTYAVLAIGAMLLSMAIQSSTISQMPRITADTTDVESVMIAQIITIIVGMVLCLPSQWVMFAVAAQRIRAFGISGIWATLIMIPILGQFLLLGLGLFDPRPGTTPYHKPKAALKPGQRPLWAWIPGIRLMWRGSKK